MENGGYLLAAFAVVWAVVFGYVLLLFNRQQRLQKQIDQLLKAGEKKEPT